VYVARAWLSFPRRKGRLAVFGVEILALIIVPGNPSCPAVRIRLMENQQKSIRRERRLRYTKGSSSPMTRASVAVLAAGSAVCQTAKAIKLGAVIELSVDVECRRAKMAAVIAY